MDRVENIIEPDLINWDLNSNIDDDEFLELLENLMEEDDFSDLFNDINIKAINADCDTGNDTTNLKCLPMHAE